MNRNRSWVVVLNGTRDEILRGQTVMETLTCAYFVGQKEKGETGNVHLQCYASFANGKTRPAVTALMGGLKPKLIVATGSAGKNKIYCTKLDTRVLGADAWSFESGIMPQQGARADHAVMMKDVLILDDVQMYEKYEAQWRNNRGVLREYRRGKMERSLSYPVITTIWGPTGGGKSHQAYMRSLGLGLGKVGLILMSPKGKPDWFGAGEGCKVVIFEDFAGGMDYTTFLRCTDKWPCTMASKGGSFTWNVSHIFITSNIKPENWYPDESYAPIRRRLLEEHEDSTITHIIARYTGPRDPPVEG